MPRLHRIIGLDGEFADIVSSIGRNDGQGIIPCIATDRKEDCTIGGVIISDYLSYLEY